MDRRGHMDCTAKALLAKRASLSALFVISSDSEFSKYEFSSHVQVEFFMVITYTERSNRGHLSNLIGLMRKTLSIENQVYC